MLGVAAAEDRHQQFVEDFVLTDDHLADLGSQPLVGVPEFAHGLDVVCFGFGHDAASGVAAVERARAGTSW